jgi:hypothetical protein
VDDNVVLTLYIVLYMDLKKAGVLVIPHLDKRSSPEPPEHNCQSCDILLDALLVDKEMLCALMPLDKCHYITTNMLRLHNITKIKTPIKSWDANFTHETALSEKS